MFKKKTEAYEGVNMEENMNELRKNVRKIVTDVIREYENRLRDASKNNEGVDLLGVNADCMEHVDKLDVFLSEFVARMKK